MPEPSAFGVLYSDGVLAFIEGDLSAEGHAATIVAVARSMR